MNIFYYPLEKRLIAYLINRTDSVSEFLKSGVVKKCGNFKEYFCNDPGDPNDVCDVVRMLDRFIAENKAIADCMQFVGVEDANNIERFIKNGIYKYPSFLITTRKNYIADKFTYQSNGTPGLLIIDPTGCEAVEARDFTISKQDNEEQFFWRRDIAFQVDESCEKIPAEVLSGVPGQPPRTTAEVIKVFKLSALNGSE